MEENGVGPVNQESHPAFDSKDILNREILQKSNQIDICILDIRTKEGKKTYVEKIIHNCSETDYLETKIEFDLMNQLSQMTNVVSPYFCGPQGTDFYIIMEWWGTSLDIIKSARLRMKKPFSSREILSWFRQLAVIMVVLEAENVYHGDIKPANILSNEGVIKLTDFGISMRLRGTLYKGTVRCSGILGYTEPYLSPELMNETPPYYMNKADVYSFGITFLELAFMVSSTDKDLLVSRRSRTIQGTYNYGEIIQFIQRQNIEGEEEISNKLKAVILACLNELPKNRPTFTQISHSLNNLDSWSLQEIIEYLGVSESPLNNSSMITIERIIIPIDCHYKPEVVKALTSQIVCIKCGGLVQDPFTCRKCQGYICEVCLKLHSNCKYCPCSARVEYLERERDIFFYSFYELLQIKCENCGNGCEKVFPLRELEGHQEICEYKLVACANEGCTKMIIQKEMSEHLTTCKMGYSFCLHCSHSFIRIDYEAHICVRESIHPLMLTLPQNYEKAIDYGKKYLTDLKYSEACRCYKLALKYLLLSTLESDERVSEIFMLISDCYSGINNISRGRKYCERGLQLKRGNMEGWHQDTCKAYRKYSWFLFKSNKYEEALDNCSKALQISKENPLVTMVDKGYIYYTLGYIYKRNKQVDNTIAALSIAFKCFQGANLVIKGDIAYILCDLEFEKNNYLKAKTHIMASLQVYKLLLEDDNSKIGDAYSKLGSISVCGKAKDFIASQKAYKKALRIFKKNGPKDYEKQAKTLYLMGEMYESQGDTKTATTFVQQSYDLWDKLKKDSIAKYTHQLLRRLLSKNKNKR